MHSVKYAYIEVYFSINNENILDLSKNMTTKKMTTKSLGHFMASSKFFVLIP